MRILTVFAIFLTLGVGACQGKSIHSFPSISTADLAYGIKDKTLHVYDNNSPQTYQEGHIPTAVFMDYHKPDLVQLPADKNAALVFYCKNTRCGASEKGAGVARAEGYQNIRVYPEGIDGWKNAGMEIESAN